MNKVLIKMLPATAFIGGFFVFYQNSPVEQKIPASNQLDQQIKTTQKKETKTDDQANVMGVVTPVDTSPQSKEWKFDVGINTHTIELYQDI